MADRSPPAPVDPERPHDRNAYGEKDSFFGQVYDQDRERAEGDRAPSGTVHPRGPATGHADTPDLPPGNGRRASFDPATGAVHGSGMGAGGGQDGEDFDDDAANGAGYPQTGKGSGGKHGAD